MHVASWCLPSGALGGFSRVLEACWAVQRPSWPSWCDLSAILSPRGPSGRPPGACLARLGALLCEKTVPEAHAEHPGSAREHMGEHRFEPQP
eukprot:4346307-Pyramimonas_sp.AAC.1